MSERTVTPEDILAARARIRGHVTKTPLLFCPFLSAAGSQVYIKMESEQKTGSFKLRGACNKLLLLAETDPASLKRGVVTASSGNHGLGCITAAKEVGCDLEVFCSQVSSASKRACMESYGARLVLHGRDCVEAETKARETAKERGSTFISPYNDPDVAAGNGTVAVEILEDLPELDAVFIAVGGGGLSGAMARYLKAVKPKVQVVGCQPVNSKVMYESVRAGRIIFEESLDTLSDGTAGGIEEGAITFELNRDYVDDWILVTEEQIAASVFFMLEKHHKLVEGAAGVAIGAYMFNKDRFAGKTIAIVSCGSNISMSALKGIVSKHCPE